MPVCLHHCRSAVTPLLLFALEVTGRKTFLLPTEENRIVNQAPPPLHPLGSAVYADVAQ